MRAALLFRKRDRPRRTPDRRERGEVCSGRASVSRSANELFADAAVGVENDECQRSVVEDVPTDRASTLLVIKDQLSNLRGKSLPLPVSFLDAC